MSTAATVVVSILGFIAFFYVNLYAGSYRMRRAASAFINALAQGRHSDAHALLAADFQEAVPKEHFEYFLADRGISSIKRFTRSHGDFSIGVDRGTVKPLLIREDGIYFPIELTMRREKMAWRVASIDAQVRLAPAPPLKAANDPHLDCVKVRVSPSYWSMVRAQLRMVFYSPLGWILSIVFPLGGAYMMHRWSTLGGVPSIPICSSQLAQSSPRQFTPHPSYYSYGDTRRHAGRSHTHSTRREFMLRAKSRRCRSPGAK